MAFPKARHAQEITNLAVKSCSATSVLHYVIKEKENLLVGVESVDSIAIGSGIRASNLKWAIFLL